MVLFHVNRGGRTLGQFSAQAISDGLSAGTFLTDDLGWKEGMDSWQPLSTFADLPPPRVLLAGGATTPALGGLARDFQTPGKVHYGECFRMAWACFQPNWGIAILGTIIFFAISGVIQIPMQIAQPVIQYYAKQGNVPPVWVLATAGLGFLVLWLISIVISSILPAGFMYFFIEALRTKQAKLGDIFIGFRKNNWVQLLLAILIWTVGFVVLAAVLLGPGIYLSVTTKSEWPAIAAGVLLAFPLVYLSIGMSFVLILIVDRNIGCWEAFVTSISTVHRQWFRVFGLLILVGLMMMAGVLACCIGLLAAMPMGYLVLGQSYRQLFGDPRAPGL